AERFCADPAMRNVVGGRAKSQAAASTSEMARFETEILSHLAESTGGKRLSCSGWVERGHGSISIGWESWLCLPPNGRVRLPGRRQETGVPKRRYADPVKWNAWFGVLFLSVKARKSASVCAKAFGTSSQARSRITPLSNYPKTALTPFGHSWLHCSQLKPGRVKDGQETKT